MFLHKPLPKPSASKAPPAFYRLGDVNYRFRTPYYIVDRMFGAAELRLGTDKTQIVRIQRTDGASRSGS